MQDNVRRQLVAEAEFGRKQPAEGRDGMVISSHPLVTRTGVEILRALAATPSTRCWAQPPCRSWSSRT